MKELTNHHIAKWPELLMAQGRYGFALSELKNSYTELSDAALKSA